MIKTIIKQDGTEEEFNPHKLNKWAEWASKTLGNYVDWSSVVLDTVSSCPAKCSSKKLQERLIKTCLDYNSWSYNRMAGRLYVPMIYKEIFDGTLPTVKELHNKLHGLGVMVKFNYSDEEYKEVERTINHKLDLKEPHFALSQVVKKYALSNKITKTIYETPQFVYMRMAMALAESQPKHRRMEDLKAWYYHFSNKHINVPTPNYVNLGTPHKGFASCCAYMVDDNANSLAIGDHIAYKFTVNSAGIGSYLQTRSLKDSVRNGLIEHQGKLPYYRALTGAVKANLQSGRGGACTTYFSCFDPEIRDLIMLKNPMTPEDKKIRGIDYALQNNKFFAKKVARNEDIFLFNTFTAPDLVEALFSSSEEFEQLYIKYENDVNFKKTYKNARDILVDYYNEGFETGKGYFFQADEVNRHTPHKDKIYSSNLCLELCQPTKPYNDMEVLYSMEEQHDSEVTMCSLAAMNVGFIKSDEDYESASYYGLLMIDKCIHMSDYPLPNVGVTAKARMNAGVGLGGVAHYLAKRGVKYSSPKGKEVIHELAERHAYWVIKASLKLGKELGNAPWIYKTKWPEGWLPIDTYNKNVDSVVTPQYNYDWETLRQEIIDNKGIRNSSLINHMPAESSSKASGTSNGVYPIRSLSLVKTDKQNAVYWCAPDGESLSNKYEIAWDISSTDLIDVYAIIQKFTDQAISADFFEKISGDDKVTSSKMIKDYLYMVKMGMKTRYYMNSKTSSLAEDTQEVCESCSI